MKLAVFWRIVALAALMPAVVGAVIDVPYLRGRVTDDAEILDHQTITQVSAQLQAHEQATGAQIAVLTVTTLDGEPIESFAQRVFKVWRLGSAQHNNGVLLIVALKDRSLRIEVGYGLEGRLTDLAAGRIIRNIMAPRFKQGDFNGGVEAGVGALLGQLRGDGDLPNDDASTAAAGRSGRPTVGLSIYAQILFGAFFFGIIGLFTAVGVLTPGVGWFIYFFLIPFWAVFPTVIFGTQITLYILITYLVLYPLVKVILSRRSWYRKAHAEMRTKGRARIGGVWFGGRGSSAGAAGGSGFSSSSSGGGGFGGGGGSGGAGASGGW